jgi:hypothetical protein
LRYLKKDGEYIAFFAVPQVIKNGIIIQENQDHKNRFYGTITFAAPVILNGERGNMAVIVKKTSKNRYKTHRILLPNGAEFLFYSLKKAEPATANMFANISNQGREIKSASSAISNPSENSNTFSEKTLVKDENINSSSKTVAKDTNYLY